MQMQKTRQKVKEHPVSSGQMQKPRQKVKADPDTRPGYNVHSVSTHVGVLIKVGDFRKARKKSPSVLHHHSTKCLRGGNQHKTEDLNNELTVKMNSLK